MLAGSISAVMSVLASSTLTHAELPGLLLPLLLCIFFCVRGATRKLGRIQLLIFLAATALTVLRQHWLYFPDGDIQLRQTPLCAIVLLFMPRKYRPSWQLGYCLVFCSAFAADVICAVQFAHRSQFSSIELFGGIGGGGFADGLFFYPASAAFGFWLAGLVARSKYGRNSFLQSARVLVGL